MALPNHRLPVLALAWALVAVLAACGSGAGSTAEPPTDGTSADTQAVATTASAGATTAPETIASTSTTAATAEIDPVELALFTLLGDEVNPVFLEEYRADPQAALDEVTADADRFCRIAEDSQASDPTMQWATGIAITYGELRKKERDVYGGEEGYGVYARVLLAWRCPDQAERLLGP